MYFLNCRKNSTKHTQPNVYQWRIYLDILYHFIPITLLMTDHKMINRKICDYYLALKYEHYFLFIIHHTLAFI